MNQYDEVAWVRLHDVIKASADSRGWTKGRLYEAVGVSEATFKKMGDGVGLSRSFAPKMRSIERGLGWPHGAAEAVLEGQGPPDEQPAVIEDEGDPTISARLDRVEALLGELLRRVPPAS